MDQIISNLHFSTLKYSMHISWISGCNYTVLVGSHIKIRAILIELRNKNILLPILTNLRLSLASIKVVKAIVKNVFAS